MMCFLDILGLKLFKIQFSVGVPWERNISTSQRKHFAVELMLYAGGKGLSFYGRNVSQVIYWSH